jgi:ribosome-associated translation inhibitor RaiA/cold shock CspA family protein
MNLRFEGLHFDIPDQWKELVQSRLSALTNGRRKILHARVTLRKSTHHNSGNDEAVVVLAIPGATLAATKQAEVVGEALTLALDAVEREWMRHWTKKQKRREKTPAHRSTHGVVARLFKDQDFGFVQTEGGVEAYFHKNSVRGVPFDRLEIGTQVICELENGQKGPQASRILIK